MSSPWEGEEGHTFSMSENGRYEQWTAPRLWEAAKGLPVTLVPIADIPYIHTDSWVMHWQDPQHPQVLFEATRTARADLAFPVILHPNGHLMDGYHRVCKALQMGFTHVQAVRFTWASLPIPDQTWREESQ